MYITLYRYTCINVHYLCMYISQNWILGRKLKKENSNLAVIETKVLIALTYYAVFGVVAMADFALFTAQNDEYTSEIYEYFVCEGKGSGSECDRTRFEQQGRGAWLHALTYALLGLLPLVNLIFVVSWKKVAHHSKTFCMKKYYRKGKQKEELAVIPYTTATT